MYFYIICVFICSTLFSVFWRFDYSYQNNQIPVKIASSNIAAFMHVFHRNFLSSFFFNFKISYENYNWINNLFCYFYSNKLKNIIFISNHYIF